jgi:DNA mismatch repair protein MutH
MRLPEREPQSLDELLSNAAQLAGLTLGEVASIAGIAVPANLKRHKGWAGQLLERALGAAAGSKSEKDFAKLGVELKTLPIDMLGQPLETTYVCYAHLTQVAGLQWQDSNVKNKLSRVLWVPVDGRREISPGQRIIATPFLWSPNAQQEKLLRQDWEELMALISLGKIDSITARHGQYLQLRPKAANGQALTTAIGRAGQVIQTRPRGFYLRKEFTKMLLSEQFV